MVSDLLLGQVWYRLLIIFPCLNDRKIIKLGRYYITQVNHIS
jgi:hypothetical protein